MSLLIHLVGMQEKQPDWKPKEITGPEVVALFKRFKKEELKQDDDRISETIIKEDRLD